MGKTITNIINRFDGGMSSDRRVNESNKFAVTKHFDAFSYKHKLVPYYHTEADETKAKNIIAFAIGSYSTTYRIYGLGKGILDIDKIAVYRHVADSSLGWGTPAGGNESSKSYAGATGLERPNILFEYKDKLYTWADNILLEYSIGGTWDDAFYDATAVTTVAEPVHHPNDDIAYFFHDNFISTLNDTVFDDKALTLPDNLKIMSACAYGNYLAIGCSTKDKIKPKSIVFLWDRDSGLTTLTSRIDFGEGVIEKLANLGNKLIALMSFHLSDVYTTKGGKVLIKEAIGDKAKTINTFLLDDVIPIGGGVMGNGVVEGDILYQAMNLEKNGDDRRGIWAIDSNGNATIDYVEEEVESADTKTYQAILKTGNVWWIAHSADGSINRTDMTASPFYSYTSIYESLIFDEGDNAKSKKLIGATVMTEALPGAGQVVLKYRKDEDLVDGSWTTIFTEDTTDSIEFDAINIGGATLPEFKEIQFRIESTGGAVITGLKWKSEFIDKQKY